MELEFTFFILWIAGVVIFSLVALLLRERREKEESYVDSFLRQMIAMGAAAGCGSSTLGALERLGFPKPTESVDLLDKLDLPTIPDEQVRTAWGGFINSLPHLRTAGLDTRRNENDVVHPVVLLLLQAASPSKSSAQLRI